MKGSCKLELELELVNIYP